MDNQAINDIVSFGNKVVPTTWMSSGGKLLPMELAVINAEYGVFQHSCFWSDVDSFARDTSPPLLPPAFILEFLDILASNGCSGLFGIDTIAKSDWTELSIGDASVVVPSNDSNDYDKEKFIPVVFTFDEEKPKFKVHGKCGKGQHKHSSKPK